MRWSGWTSLARIEEDRVGLGGGPVQAQATLCLHVLDRPCRAAVPDRTLRKRLDSSRQIVTADLFNDRSGATRAASSSSGRLGLPGSSSQPVTMVHQRASSVGCAQSKVMLRRRNGT
jgi:hypothetical protein